MPISCTVVETSLERIDRDGLYDGLWQSIPVMDNPLTVEIFLYVESWPLYLKFHAVPSCTVTAWVYLEERMTWYSLETIQYLERLDKISPDTSVI